MRATCSTCGAVFEREIPADLSEWGRSKLLELPALCASCVEIEEDIERVAARDQAHREQAEQLKRRCAAAGIPATLRGLRWGELTEDGRCGGVEAARSWAKGELAGVVLTGSVGVGKTRIAATAAWARLDLAPLHWLSTPLLFARLGTGLGSRQRDEALEVLAGATALVMDDLDKVRPTEYAAEQVFLAIDNRINEGAALLATTNLTLSALAEKFPEPFGEAIASRLAGHCETFALHGVDRRLEEAA